MPSKRKKQKKHTGRFCWCCERQRPNEGFSGGGHARHLCRECKTLGADELAFRQARRNLAQLLRWDLPIIPRRKREQFEKFLVHPIERVRRHAEELLANDRRERRMLRAIEAQDAGAYEAMLAYIEETSDLPPDVEREPTGDFDDDIPF